MMEGSISSDDPRAEDVRKLLEAHLAFGYLAWWLRGWTVSADRRTRELAEVMGGRIELDSQNGWTLFTLVLSAEVPERDLEAGLV